MAVAPGTEFAYCSPGSHLMSAMIARAAATSTLEFANKNLFDPLGITDVTWPSDPQGVYEARGRSGQAIVVWPDKDVVAIFTGRGLDVRGEAAPVLVTAMKSDSAIDPNPEAYARLNQAIEDATKPPQAKPVPALPPMAEEVSGKVYRLADNQFGVSCISLRFDSPSGVWFDLTLGSGLFALPVGMDGVPRFSETRPTGIPVGVLGEWTEPNEFSMQYDEVGGSNHLRIRGNFADDSESVALEFTHPGEYFPSQTVPGSSVPSCN